MNKIMLRSVIVGLTNLSLVMFTEAAGTAALEGIVKDAGGRPIKGADVHVEAKSVSKTVKTDASGHYVCSGLAVGTYKVTLVANGRVKASIVNAKAQTGKARQLNFDLTGKMAPATKKHTHMVYVHADIDSHIGGGGKWIEVDDNGNPVDNSGTSNINKVSGTAVQDSMLRSRGQLPGR